MRFGDPGPRVVARELIAVGVHHLVVVDGAMRMHRGDRRARQVVIVADADKRQQLVTIGDRHCTDTQLLINHPGDLHAVFLIEALAQDALGALGDLQRLGRESAGVFLKHRAPIQQDLHEHRRTDGIGDHHRQRDVLYQLQRFVVGARHREDDRHLQHFRHQRHAADEQRIEQQLDAPAAHGDAVYDAADQAFRHRGNRAGHVGHAAERIPVQAAGQPDQKAHRRPAQQPAQDRAYRAGVGDRILNVQPKIGAHDAEHREDHVAQQLVRQANSHLHQRDKQRGFAQQIGDDEIDAHLLQQQQHLVKFIHGSNSSRDNKGRTPDFRSGYCLPIRAWGTGENSDEGKAS